VQHYTVDTVSGSCNKTSAMLHCWYSQWVLQKDWCSVTLLIQSVHIAVFITFFIWVLLP